MPLFWLSISFLIGILLAALMSLHWLAWLALAGLAVLYAICSRQLMIFSMHYGGRSLSRMLGFLPFWGVRGLVCLQKGISRLALPVGWLLVALCLGGARYQAVLPQIGPTDLAYYNDSSESLVLDGWLLEVYAGGDGLVVWLLADDGRRLYLDCRGSGSPTVVLEAGSGMDARSWGTVFPALAPRNCSRSSSGIETPRAEPDVPWTAWAGCADRGAARAAARTTRSEQTTRRTERTSRGVLRKNRAGGCGIGDLRNGHPSVPLGDPEAEELLDGRKERLGRRQGLDPPAELRPLRDAVRVPARERLQLSHHPLRDVLLRLPDEAEVVEDQEPPAAPRNIVVRPLASVP